MKTIAVLLAAMVSCHLLAETYYLDNSISYNSGSHPNPMTNAYNWIAADGKTHAGNPGDAIPSDGIYFLRGYESLGNEGKIRIKTKNPTYVFKELHIGDLANAREGHVIVYGEDNTVNFDGATYFEKGRLVGNRGNNNQYTFSGNFAVKSTASSPFFVAAGYQNSSVTLKGSLSAVDNTATMKFGGSNGYTSKDPDCSTYRFDLDFSGYDGELYFNNDDTTKRTASLFPQTFEFVKSSLIPGKIKVEHDTRVKIFGGDTKIQVANMTIGDNVMLGFSANGTKASGLTVTGSFVWGTSRYLDLTVESWVPGTSRCTLLTVPIASAASLEEVNCSISGVMPLESSFSTVTDEAAGTCSLVCTYMVIPEGGVYLKTGDSDNKDNNNAADRNSSLTNALNWSDGLLPSSGKDYFLTKVDGKSVVLRTLQHGWSDGLGMTSDNYVFPGDSLTVLGQRMVLCSGRIKFNKLNLHNGSVLVGVNAGPDTKFISGTVEVHSGSVYLQENVGDTMRFDGTVLGSGEFVLQGVHPGGNPQGNYSFSGANMNNFKGRIRVSANPSNLNPDFAKTNQMLLVSGAAQLGGKLDEFDPGALTLERCGTLRVRESFTVSADKNRGITVSGKGRIYVDSGKKLDIRTPMMVSGLLRKSHAGTLRLASKMTIGEDPQADSVLELTGGTLQLGHSEAINGMTLAVSNNTSVVLEVNPADADMKAYGIRMEKASLPFVLDAGMEKLPVSLLATSAILGGEMALDCAILTVRNDPAIVAQVRSMLPESFDAVFPRYSQKLVEIEDDEKEMLTFALRLVKCSMRIVVR